MLKQVSPNKSKVDIGGSYDQGRTRKLDLNN